VVWRGEGVEAWHAASVAVVDGSGHLTHYFVDPNLAPFARSAIKPFQVLALLESGAADALGIEPEEIAIACGSHSGSDEHVRVVDRLLEKAGAGPEDLLCGAHLPIEWRVRGRSPLAGEDRDPRRNACSGKHAAFLAVARHLGEARADYLDPAGRVQTPVRSKLAEACGVVAEELPSGIDGCSAPNYALPLCALARAMMRLARAELGSRGLNGSLARVREAMHAHALLVSGEQRFDHDLMRAFPRNVLCKIGAEGLELIAFEEPPLAFAVKIHDGSDRALAPVCVAVLEQLELLRGETPPSLLRHRRPKLLNHRRLETGEITATLQLIPVV